MIAVQLRMAEALFTFWNDLRYGLRMLAKAPAFAAVAIITLGLGIGANTAIFSLINAVLLRRLPVPDAQHLLSLQWSAHKPPKFNSHSTYGDTEFGMREVDPVDYSFSAPFLRQVEKSGVFSGVAAWASAAGDLVIIGNGAVKEGRGQFVSGGYFNTLGVRPALGRVLDLKDDGVSAPAVAVLNYSYWLSSFGGSPSVIGKVVNLNGVPTTIVGVAERSFVSLSTGNVQDLWVPFSMEPRLGQGEYTEKRLQNESDWWILMTARVKPGLSVAQAQAAVDLLFQNSVLHGDPPLSQPADAPRLRLVPAQSVLAGSSTSFAEPLRLLMMAVGVVLLIACANVAGLVLARSSARSGELAVRLALGARRSRLLRQLLTESLLLSLMGGVVAVVMALWAGPAILAARTAGDARPPGFEARLDFRVLAFTFGVALLSGLIAGIAPALRSLRLDLTPALKVGTNSLSAITGGRRRWLTLGNGLVMLQAALAVVVLMAAGLLVRSLQNLKNVRTGFDAHNVLLFSIDPRLNGYKRAQADNFYREVQQEIQAMPGVTSVSYSGMKLLSGAHAGVSFKYLPPGSSTAATLEADWISVGQGFFHTMSIPLAAGRDFSQADFAIAARDGEIEDHIIANLKNARSRSLGPPLPVIVNHLFVNKYFHGLNPLGQAFGASDGSDPDDPIPGPGFVIVGVAEDAKYNSLRREAQPTMYNPLTGTNAAFEVRTAGDPNAMVSPVRKLIAEHDANIPVTGVRTQQEQIDLTLRQERFLSWLSSLFGALAMLLAAVGLYGLLSFEVSRRTREIGIRMALGARRVDLIRLVVWRGAALALGGVVVGMAAALGMGRVLQTLAFHARSTDPGTLLAVAGLLMAVALCAALVPARRASSVDPLVALRYQ